MAYVCINNNGRINETKSSTVKQGDHIKLGKSFFRVAETHLTPSSAAQLPESKELLQLDNLAESSICGLAKTCRICLMEDN
jgi:hypothetical protein